MSEVEREEPIVRDKRRIDPTTGAVRQPGPSGPVGAAGGAGAAGPPGVAGTAAQPGAGGSVGLPDGPADAEARRRTEEETAAADQRSATAEAKVAELTADLQRVSAEYANYRKRVDRDRSLVTEIAIANVLGNLLPVLDDIGRARDHGELEGGFRAVGEGLEAIVEKLGLTRYGAVGEPFDPTVHEALLHSTSDEVTEPTCVQVLQPGYRVGDRVLRPARVAVAEPGAGFDQ